MSKYIKILWILILPMSIVMLLLSLSGALTGNDEHLFVYSASSIVSISHTYLIVMAISRSKFENIKSYTKRDKIWVLLPLIHPFTYMPVVFFLYLYFNETHLISL